MRTAGILRAWCLSLAIPAMAWAAIPPKTIYVDADAPGPHNGTSWPNAFSYLQDGLAGATAGDTIRVAQGLYKPNQASSPLPGGRTVTFKLKTGVGIYGGYAGYGTPNPNLRNVALYKTSLSGDLDGNDVIVEINDANLVRTLLTAPTRQDNAYTVVTGSGTEPNAVLDGFIVTGGNANGPADFPYMYERGGGLFSYRGSPTIRNCTFKVNAAASYGGAVANSEGKSLIENCTFRANYSTGGGAGINNWSSNTTTRNCTFQWNNVYFQKWGGAIYSRDSNPKIEGCAFTENYGGMEGGALANDYSDANVTDCRFTDNSAEMGGAVWNNVGAYPTFARCTFVGNFALDWGGAVFNYYCTAALTECTFIANESDDAGGGVYNRYSEATMVNCQFNGNTASQTGGGVGNYDTDIRLINCTFSANFAPKGNAVGCEPGGSQAKTHATITNCILWDGGAEIFKSVDDLIDVTYSDVQGGWIGGGNISGNPLFVDALGPDLIAGTEDDNLRLSAHSPCIDAGANYAVPIEISVDLAGRPRFVDDPATPDTGNGTPPLVDMGAYEYQTGGGPVNHAPIANAGPDQTVPAGPDGSASVTLDGSGSHDMDGDPLFYTWSWVVAGHPYHAYGVSPTIQLPIGQHTVTLVVFDGIANSNPDQVVITVQVQGPIDADVWMYPYLISRYGGGAYVFTLARLYGIHSHEVDLSVPLTISPGGVEAFSQDVSEQSDGCVVTAIFHKSDLTNAIPTNGVIMLTVTGWLTSGQTFQGADTVKLTN